MWGPQRRGLMGVLLCSLLPLWVYRLAFNIRIPQREGGGGDKAKLVQRSDPGTRNLQQEGGGGGAPCNLGLCARLFEDQRRLEIGPLCGLTILSAS